MAALSIRGYGRHRGVSHVAVLKALREGRIEANADGSIDRERADAAWDANTRPRPHRNGSPTVAESNRALMDAKAGLARLELRRRRGDLVSLTSVESAVFEACRRVRERLHGIPARLAPVVAGLSDVDACFVVVEVEINHALDELSALSTPTSGARRRRTA